MGLTIRTALLAACMTLGSQLAQAQDQEEGPVELAPTPQEVSPPPVQASVSSSGSLETRGSARRIGTEPAGALRVYAGFRLGVGGGVKPTEPDQDLIQTAKATPGLQIGVDYVVMDYFAIGGETRLAWAGLKAGGDRFMLWDIVAKPRARMLLSSQPLELYAAMPIGISVSNQDDDLEPEVTGKAHATLGLAGGAYYFFTQHMGVNAELGWQWNWLRAEVEGADDTFKSRLGQLTLLNVNFVYAF